MNLVRNLLFKLVIILVTFELFNSQHEKQDICDQKWPRCGAIQNIVCERGGTCKVVNNSCQILKADNKFRRFILNEHNRLRNRIAVGNDTRGGAGPAGNMMALSYDYDLEYVVSCNIYRCLFEHDKCRATKKFPYAGQNLLWSAGRRGMALMNNAVMDWYEEIVDMDAERFDSYHKHDDPEVFIGHFTQLLWATTTHVGCAKATFPEKKEFFIGCNYGPGGNKIHKPVFLRGDPCSKCPLGVKCNKHYHGLCGEIEFKEEKDAQSGNMVVMNCVLNWRLIVFGIYLLVGLM